MANRTQMQRKPKEPDYTVMTDYRRIVYSGNSLQDALASAWKYTNNTCSLGQKPYFDGVENYYYINEDDSLAPACRLYWSQAVLEKLKKRYA